MSKRVAYLSADCMQSDSPNRREDYWEHDLQFAALAPACAQVDIDLQTVVWDANDWDAAQFDALVIGTPWDYMERPEAFLQRLEELSAQAPLFNSLETLRWNFQKTYLRDLEERGARIVPTLWGTRADEDTIQRAFQEFGQDFGCEELVIKPTIGAGAWRQARLKRGDPCPPPEQLPPAECMLQPFLPAVASEGEYSFLFFGREYSHCLLKVPQAGDYRVQAFYGAHEHHHEPSQAEANQARAVLDSVPDDLLYARVDMVRGLDGELALMELELIEPYLYPEQGPNLGKAFASALNERVRA